MDEKQSSGVFFQNVNIHVSTQPEMEINYDPQLQSEESKNY